MNKRNYISPDIYISELDLEEELLVGSNQELRTLSAPMEVESDPSEQYQETDKQIEKATWK